MEKLRVGQIGVGNFGGYRRSRMRETGLFDLVAAYDYNPLHLADAETRDGARACSSYEELLATPGLEGIVISTGAKDHAAQALQAMRKGLHVFVEKPVCATPDEARALFLEQRRSGVAVGVGHTDHDHEKFSRHVKKLIESGELGSLVAVEATTCHSGGLLIQKGDWRGDPAKNPGGMLFQCGVHKLHELMYYCGPVTKVSAMMRYDANNRTATADAAVCNLQFENGVVGSLNAYHITPYRHFIYLYGTKANLYLELHGVNGTTLYMQKVAVDRDNMEPVVPVEVEGESDACGNLRAWYDAIRSNGSQGPTLQDGLRAVAVVFAAEEAASKECTMPVETFTD